MAWGGGAAGDLSAIEMLDLVYKRTESTEATALSRGPVAGAAANQSPARKEGARVLVPDAGGDEGDDGEAGLGAVEVERILTEEGPGGAIGAGLPGVPSLVRTLTDLSRRTGQAASETASTGPGGARANPSAARAGESAGGGGPDGARRPCAAAEEQGGGHAGGSGDGAPFGCDGLRNMDLEQFQRDLAYFGRNYVLGGGGAAAGGGENGGAEAACSSAQQECHYMDHDDDEDDDDYDEDDDDEEDEDDDDGMLSDD
jgi:hypothetical protein